MVVELAVDDTCVEEEEETDVVGAVETTGAAEEMGRTGEDEAVERPEDAVMVADSSDELKLDMSRVPLAFDDWLIAGCACPGRQTSVHPEASTLLGT